MSKDVKKTNEIMKGVVSKVSQAGKKGRDLASDVISQTTTGSKVLATELAKGAKELHDKTKIDSYNRRMKKYNPLFQEEYESEDFYIPNIIGIVDDAIRRDIDVCKGAIGWRENKRGTEVLFLYDEFIKDSGITFVPTEMCDEFYYVDTHDRNRYIKLDYIFQLSHEEKLAELEHIAYALGAKSCSIEFEEVQSTHDKKKRTTGVKEGTTTVTASENYDTEMISDKLQKRTSKSETIFKGNDVLSRPQLKWFVHDKNIQNLIEHRCNGGNEITSKTLELSGASSATMSRKAAYSIDAAVSDIGVGHAYSLEDNSVKESTLKIIYHLEF